MKYDSRFSLTGLLSSSTEPQEALIKRVVEVATSDDRVLAVYLVGGFAVGTGDAWSDVDLQFVIREEAEEGLRASWTDVANQLARTAHVQPFGAVIGGMCITPEWLHFDVVFNTVSKVDPRTVEGMVPLLDKVGVLPVGPVSRPGRQTEPFFPEAAVEHFLYMLGNMVSVVARNEVVPASNGVIIVRDIDLVGLFLAEQGWATTREHSFGNPFPFTKRLRSYLTDEQNEILEALPPVAASIDSVIEGYIALASVFLPRARALAERTGATWPIALEKASVGYFERSLGVEIPL
jgi:Streptomycin adenylyltransferase